MDKLPVLIVGAGPSGLAAALVLAQNGIHVRIVDKEESFHVGSRGFGVQARTFELFEILGTMDDVREQFIPLPPMRAYELPGGKVPLKTWPLYLKREVTPDRPFPNFACLRQDLSEEIFRRHLARYGVFVELGKALVDLSQDEDRVTATVARCQDGKLTDEKEIISANYMIGADGARGASRKLLGLEFQGETRDADGMIWGDVEIDGLDNDHWHIWGKPGKFSLFARPTSHNGNKFGFGIIGQEFDPTHLADPEKAKEFFVKETGRTDLKFGEFSWFSYFRPNIRMITRFQEGRVFVVGDAAHVHSPTGGQGMNSSIQDSFNIAWKLALVLKNLSAPTLLSTFNTERHPIITQMLQATTALYDHALTHEHRTTSITPTTTTTTTTAPTDPDDDDSKSGWFRWRNNALEMFGINYRFSPIILEERIPKPLNHALAIARAYAGYQEFDSGDEIDKLLRAGDRAPDAPGLGLGKWGKADGNGDITTTTLFKLFRMNVHTVLVFGGGRGDGWSGYEGLARVLGKWPPSAIQVLVLISSSDQERVEEAGLGEDFTVLVDTQGHAHVGYRVAPGESVVVVVRPDGFIGAIVKEVAGIDRYFSRIFV